MATVGTPEFEEWCRQFAEHIASRPKPRKLPHDCLLCGQTIKSAMGYPNGRCPLGKCPELLQITPPEVDDYSDGEPEISDAEFMRLIEDYQSGQKTLFD